VNRYVKGVYTLEALCRRWGQLRSVLRPLDKTSALLLTVSVTVDEYSRGGWSDPYSRDGWSDPFGETNVPHMTISVTVDDHMCDV
jgi:hypothetical protein